MSLDPTPAAVEADDVSSAVERFAAQAAAVSAVVRRTTPASLPSALVVVLQELGSAEVVVEPAALAAFPQIGNTLSAAGIDLSPNAEPAALTRLGAAVSLAACGIVETGSVVVAPSSLRDRLLGMLPEAHVVLLRTSDLIGDLDAAGARLQAWTTGSSIRPYVSFITGPSRTADIERVLTIGVQGPRALYVLLVEDA